MLLKYQYAFFLFFAIYLTITDAQLTHHSSDVNEQNLLTAIAGYRHRFDRSMNFKKLRWTLAALNATAICDACDLLIPEVILSLESRFCIHKTYILDASVDWNQSIRFN